MDTSRSTPETTTNKSACQPRHDVSDQRCRTGHVNAKEGLEDRLPLCVQRRELRTVAGLFEFALLLLESDRLERAYWNSSQRRYQRQQPASQHSVKVTLLEKNQQRVCQSKHQRSQHAMRMQTRKLVRKRVLTAACACPISPFSAPVRIQLSRISSSTGSHAHLCIICGCANGIYS
jgi:hypothetical protein